MRRRALLLLLAQIAMPRAGIAQGTDSLPTRGTVSISMAAAVERSVATSSAVKLATARRDEADAAIGTARAARRPTITANAQFSWQPTANTTGATWAPDPSLPIEQRVRYLELAAPAAALSALNPQILASAAEYAWIGGLTSQTTLLDGGRTRSAVRVATARRDAAEATIEAERARVRLDAELAYRQLQLARERVAAAERARATTARDLETRCGEWSRGLVSELDVLRTEMRLADLGLRVADAISAERSADLQLRLIADLPTDATLDLTTPVDVASLVELVSTELSALLDAVQEADRRSAAAAVSAADAELRAARAKRRPSLVLRTDLQAIRAPEEPFALGGAWQGVAVLSAGLQVPLVRPSQRSEERAAKARLAQAQVDVRRVADGAHRETQLARAERHRARAAWQSARERLRAAERAAEITASAVASGIATPTDEARSQLDVIETRAQVLQFLIDYLSADAVAGTASRAAADVP